jgi:hypothetical protein
VAAVRSKLERFPEIVSFDLDLSTGRATMEAEPTFYQYVALERAIGEAAGAIKMFHPSYLVPRAHYAMLGTDRLTQAGLEALRERLEAVPGVRVAVVDEDRWFINDAGLMVGGAVIFADRNPRLRLDLKRAAAEAGFVLEHRHHGDQAAEVEKWSMTNHAFAGLCLIFLAVLGMLQAGLASPPRWIRLGSPAIWLLLFVFLFIRADRSAWPLGEMGWWESFQDPEIAQHRLGIGLLGLVAMGDLFRVRSSMAVNPVLSRWGILLLGLVGSALLFRHQHHTLDPAHEWMVRRMNVQHLAMGSAGLLFALSKFAWDTWQIPRNWGRYLWLLFLMVLGILLNLYIE